MATATKPLTRAQHARAAALLVFVVIGGVAGYTALTQFGLSDAWAAALSSGAVGLVAVLAVLRSVRPESR